LYKNLIFNVVSRYVSMTYVAVAPRRRAKSLVVSDLGF